jgi:hypothetical protein
MLYPIELRLHEEHVNKSPFPRSVKPDFCERKSVLSVVPGMKPIKPDALLPFAIAAILGFLVLGLNGGEREHSAKPREPIPAVERADIDSAKTARHSSELRVRLDAPPSPAGP